MPYYTCFEERAREEALAQGLSQGLSEGITRGVSKGQLLALRESIRDLLEERFGFIPVAIMTRLEVESDTEQLRRWNRRAATIGTVEEFQTFTGC
jgi:hypothetical protein